MDSLDGIGSPAAAVPALGVDARIALATTLRATSTTAVLLGSGVSSSAGILTGWGVVLDLIREVATVQGVPERLFAEHPDRWWFDQGHGEPRYDEVLAAVAPREADRRLRLRRYFESTDESGQQVQPTAAHEALAAFAARGSLPVIVTTNFDRLMERALSAAGVDAQILTEPAQVAGMTPLRHAGVTVVKLHGDYAGGKLRNVTDELTSYPRPWRQLLAEVFDQYGLLVLGWSADYDTALAAAVASGAGRRYAWYWAAHQGRVGDVAAQLIINHGAHPIVTKGADELMTDLVVGVNALDALAARRRRARRGLDTRGLMRSRPESWTQLPIVILIVIARMRPPDPESVGEIDPEVRERLLAGLAVSPLTAALQNRGESATDLLWLATDRPVTTDGGHVLQGSDRIPVSGLGQPPPVDLKQWLLPARGYQSTSNALYEIGGTGEGGLCALFRLALPENTGSSEAELTMTIGLNQANGVNAVDVARLWRDAALSCVGELATEVGYLLGVPFAAISDVELQWWVPAADANNVTRLLPPETGLHLGLFGETGRPASENVGYRELLDEVLDSDSAGELVCRAMRKIALDAGYVDPRGGLSKIRHQLRLLADP